MSKNPKLAFFLSLILPGSGHLYVGRNLIGLLVLGMFILWLISVISNHRLGMLYLLFIAYITLAGDAYRTAKKENNAEKVLENPKDSKKKHYICPDCGTENINNESCQNCGRNLTEILFFSKGNTSDVAITKRCIIIYKKNVLGKRTGKTNNYYIYKIRNVIIKDSSSSPMSSRFGNILLEFYYTENKNRPEVKKSIYINEDDVYELIDALELRKIPYEGKNLFKIDKK